MIHLSSRRRIVDGEFLDRGSKSDSDRPSCRPAGPIPAVNPSHCMSSTDNHPKSSAPRLQGRPSSPTRRSSGTCAGSAGETISCGGRTTPAASAARPDQRHHGPPGASRRLHYLPGPVGLSR